MFFRLLVLTSLFLFPTWSWADPPADLEQLLQREPITAASWPTWSQRLRDWSNEHFQTAFPAFRQAFDFVKELNKSGKRFPGKLDQDPVLWMILAGSYLHDAKPTLKTAEVGAAAMNAVKKCNDLERRANGPKLARNQYYQFWAIQKEQLSPPDQGGPPQPDRNRLRDGLKALQQARALAPNVVWVPAAEAGKFAAAAEKWDDAESFFGQALQEQPDDRDLARRLARAVNAQKFPAYRRDKPFAAGVEPLVRHFPDDGLLVCEYAYSLALDKQHDAASQQLARARQLGADPARVIDANLVKELDEEQARKSADRARQQTEDQRRSQNAESQKFVRDLPAWALLILGSGAAAFTIFYGGLMLAMSLAGWALARSTRGARAADLLGSIDGAAPGQAYRTKAESNLTRWYALALFLALVFFYLALPFVFLGLLVVFAAFLLLTLFLPRHRDENDVHAAVLRASGGGMAAVFKALFARTGPGGFGVRKDRTQCPRLFGAIEEVAQRVGIDVPDEVWLAPGAEFSVYQKGRGPFGVFGGRERVLTVGLCVLPFLTVAEFKSILAHEFAHFSHADTFWHRFLFQVSLSLRTATREMARSGRWVTWGNPFFWFFWLYSKSYSLLAAGFSRSREFLADRMACSLYGSDVFTEALRKVCADGAHFERVVYKNVARLLRQKQAFVNMYLAFRKHRDETLTADERARRDKELLDDRPSLFASHPTFPERAEAAAALPKARKPDATPAIGLFENAEAVEKELTDYVTDAMQNGIA